jgi:hypothetical protein
MTRLAWPYPERYGYTWIQHPNGLYDSPPYASEDDQLVLFEWLGTLGYSSVWRGDYRYVLRDPDHEEEAC